MTQDEAIERARFLIGHRHSNTTAEGQYERDVRLLAQALFFDRIALTPTFHILWKAREDALKDELRGSAANPIMVSFADGEQAPT